MRKLIVTSLAAVVLGSLVASAALNVQSDGSDGALNITADTEIDLSQAVTGTWSDDNSANSGIGIYDPVKWAVVYKYSSVSIAAGATVTFKNHPSRAPVVWLVSGDVTIDGTINLDGQTFVPPPGLSEGGPGAFRGGSGNYAPGATDGAGFGPGGGGRRVVSQTYGSVGGAGSYGSVGMNGGPIYGNMALIPLVGGSGGGGRAGSYNDSQGHSGCGGGGAILLACGGTLTISASGKIQANGGNGRVNGYTDYDYPSGSGGGIRLVAHTLSGNGIVQALGGLGAYYGGLGRIRIERAANTSELQLTPGTSPVKLDDGSTPQLWMPDNGPTVRIVSIGGNAPPDDPRAEFGSIGADVVLPQVTTTPVVIETVNVEEASVVTVRVTPRSDGNFTETAATVTEVIDDDPKTVRWTADVPVKNGYAAMQVKVVRP
ncbi:MAG TPA: hypothetical protein P5525_20695 [Candidatus Paceibacterota bacterium]|nr:hypothetical protein [Candidatus Paceibacterota bacterium]